MVERSHEKLRKSKEVEEKEDSKLLSEFSKPMFKSPSNDKLGKSGPSCGTTGDGTRGLSLIISGDLRKAF